MAERFEHLALNISNSFVANINVYARMTVLQYCIPLRVIPHLESCSFPTPCIILVLLSEKWWIIFFSYAFNTKNLHLVV